MYLILLWICCSTGGSRNLNAPSPKNQGEPNDEHNQNEDRDGTGRSISADDTCISRIKDGQTLKIESSLFVMESFPAYDDSPRSLE